MINNDALPTDGASGLNYTVEPVGPPGPDTIELLVRLYLCPSYDVMDLVTETVSIHYCSQGRQITCFSTMLFSFMIVFLFVCVARIFIIIIIIIIFIILF